MYYVLAPDHSNRFPYLLSDTLSLSKKERERLKARLEIESEKMKDRYAILVDRVRESLEKKHIACSDLSVLVRHSSKNILAHLTKEHTNMKDLFLELADYWTFFDYEFLRLIIGRHCQELTPELTEYESSFKEYCKRRLCELPDDVFANTGDKSNLYMKIDRNFTTSTLEDVKKLGCKLSLLLDTDLCLLKVEKGCIKLTFNSLCAISSPLTPEQIETLKELKVMHLYSDSMEYFFNSTDTNSEKDTGNWCFKDGTISFEEVFEIYKKVRKEKEKANAHTPSTVLSWPHNPDSCTRYDFNSYIQPNCDEILSP